MTQKQFMESYLAETGRAWIHHYPRRYVSVLYQNTTI